MITRRVILVSVSTVLLGWLSIVVFSGLGWNPLNLHWDFSNTGAFGDSFGPLSASMASIAALSAIATYRSQQRESRRVAEQALQEKALSDKRDFENTFFNLLDFFRQILKEVSSYPLMSDIKVEGRDAIRAIIYSLIPPENDHVDNWTKYAKTYSEHRDDLAHYFRLFYHILRLVDNSRVDDKMFYARLLRAMLSDAELTLIALNCMFGGGSIKLKPLIEEYAILHSVSSTTAEKWKMANYFDLRAFGNRGISDWQHKDLD